MLDSLLKLCLLLPPSAEAESQCRRTRRACAFKCSSPVVILSRGCWKHNSNFRSLISRPLKRTSTFDGLHNSMSASLIIFQRSQWMQESVVDGDEQEKQSAFMYRHLHKCSFFWWKTTLSLTRTSTFSHTEQFKHFDLAVGCTSYFSVPASGNQVIIQLRPDGNTISIDQLIALDAANMWRDSQCYYDSSWGEHKYVPAFTAIHPETLPNKQWQQVHQSSVISAAE